MTKQQCTASTPGFAIELESTTELGTATLIVEDEEGHYEPVGHACNIREGREIAEDDARCRMRKFEAGGDPGLCPARYKLWARGTEGKKAVAAAWNASDLV
jgi:hypothetical protein